MALNLIASFFVTVLFIVSWLLFCISLLNIATAIVVAFTIGFMNNNSKKKQRTDTKNEANKIKSDKLTESNREKFI